MDVPDASFRARFTPAEFESRYKFRLSAGQADVLDVAKLSGMKVEATIVVYEEDEAHLVNLVLVPEGRPFPEPRTVRMEFRRDPGPMRPSRNWKVGPAWVPKKVRLARDRREAMLLGLAAAVATVGAIWIGLWSSVVLEPVLRRWLS